MYQTPYPPVNPYQQMPGPTVGMVAPPSYHEAMFHPPNQPIQRTNEQFAKQAPYNPNY